MGLDWLPGNKPKPGFEAEFNQIFGQVADAEASDDRDALVERLMEISTSAYETLGAPRVGQSEAADRWARKAYQANDLDMTEDQFLEEMAGYYVLDLVPPCDGIPRYSNSPLGYVEEYSFRGQFLHDCEDIIGEDLLEKAYENMLPGDFLSYGQALMTKAEHHATSAGLDIPAIMKKAEAAPDQDEAEGDDVEAVDLDETESKIHIVVSAARWCTFWAERGHILNVDW